MTLPQPTGTVLCMCPFPPEPSSSNRPSCSHFECLHNGYIWMVFKAISLSIQIYE